MKRKKVFLTGATGVMGGEGLKELLNAGDAYAVKALVRPNKKNAQKMAPFVDRGVEVIWGDLCNAQDIAEGVKWADIVLHVGGMVSPAADWFPKETYKTNTMAMSNIVKAAQQYNPDVKIVYIGSVAQYGNREVPNHWGGVGEPLLPAYYDAYAYSKTEAERTLAESGLKYWVSLRQTGILHWGLLLKASDPISFHVPIRGVLEWATAEDSGRLLERVCRDDVPESFWCDFYNIGGGAAYRLTNYEFEQQLLAALGCPSPEKVFESNWFATGNFHGMWYTDSDRLENILHFRRGDTPKEYFKYMKSKMPWYFNLAPLAPGFLIKAMMGKVAKTRELGPMDWIATNNIGRIDAAWGSREEWEKIPDWRGIDVSRPDDKDPGESPRPEYTLKEMQKYALSRGGECLTTEMTDGDADAVIRMRCAEGHEFEMRARTLIRGGHWCPECLRKRARMPE